MGGDGYWRRRKWLKKNGSSLSSWGGEQWLGLWRISRECIGLPRPLEWQPYLEDHWQVVNISATFLRFLAGHFAVWKQHPYIAVSHVFVLVKFLELIFFYFRVLSLKRGRVFFFPHTESTACKNSIAMKPTPTFANTPLDLLITICIFLQPTDILALRKVCHQSTLNLFVA